MRSIQEIDDESVLLEIADNRKKDIYIRLSAAKKLANEVIIQRIIANIDIDKLIKDSVLELLGLHVAVTVLGEKFNENTSQFKSIQKIGERLDDVGGKQLMFSVYEQFREKLKDNSGIFYGHNLEICWDGIGDYKHYAIQQRNKQNYEFN